MLKIKTSNQNFIEFQKEGEAITLNGIPLNWDFVELAHQKSYHIIKENKSYSVEVLKFDRAQKLLFLRINDRELQVTIQDARDQLLEKLGVSQKRSETLNDIKAPMPGKVLEIKVQEGQTIEKGDPVLILEAMKMENLIKSPGAGTVKSIQIKEGQSVEKNQVLIRL